MIFPSIPTVSVKTDTHKDDIFVWILKIKQKQVMAKVHVSILTQE